MTDRFIDKDFGQIIIRRNSRAKRLIARRSEYHLLLTVPENYPFTKIRQVFEEMKPRLMSLKSKKKIVFDENTEFKTYSFVLRIIRHPLQNYYYKLENGILYISCPRHIDIQEQQSQLKIKSIVEAFLRSEAKRILPLRLKELSEKYSFTYSQMKINGSKTRWGSCSSKRNINISFLCMLLPVHLIDFVLLHELCHTIEMNHGEKFWQLLDKITGGQAKLLTKELAANSMEW